MGTRLWAALLVCLGSAAGAQAVPISLSLPVTVTELWDWDNNPYGPPNVLAIGDAGTISYGFDSDDLVTAAPGCGSCFGDVTVSVLPWSFQASFPGASFSGFGVGNPVASLSISLMDGAVDILRLDASEDDATFHTLILTDPTGTALSASDLLAPGGFLAGFSSSQFPQRNWQLATQPGGVAIAENAIPEPGALGLFALGLLALQRSGRRYHSSGA